MTSVNDQYGMYGSPYSTTSACNPYTVSPPAIFDEAGCYYGRLSVNQYVSGSVCGIFGDAALCDDLVALCNETEYWDYLDCLEYSGPTKLSCK